MKLTHTHPGKFKQSGKYALAAAVLAAGLLVGLRPAQAGSPQTVSVTTFPGADGTYLPSGFSLTAGSGASSNTLTFSSSDGTDLYRHAGRLWLLLPVMLLWVSQLWLLASRAELNEDPVVYAITDKRSLLLGVLVVLIVLSAL